MQKPISRMQHGIADWLLIPVLVVLPYVVGFADVPTARSVSWITAIAILAGVVSTRAEWGVFRFLPYRVHLMGDAALGFMLMLSPWLVGFAGSPTPRNTFLILGAAVFSAGALLSRPEEMPDTAGSPRTSLERLTE